MKHVANSTAVFLFCIMMPALFGNSPGSALEMNQAIESCRSSTGRPAYMACKQAGGTHEACFGKAKSIVQSCVRTAMTAARPKAALFSAEKLAAPPGQGQVSAGEAAKDAAATLVAPPRTISDITAILDQQKPDAAEIARLAATADAAVPTGLKGAELADFHYKRAQARVLLGRADALDDAELSVSNAPGGGDYKNLGSRYEELLMRLLCEAGQQKRANALLTKQLAAFANQSKGKLFGLNYVLALGYLKSGDTNAAESYAARNRALLTEAQRWPVFPIYGMAWQGIVEDGTARIEESRGRLPQAEAAYHRASIFYESALKTLSQWESKPAEGQMERSTDWALALEGRTKVKQGRVGEGEADVRRALLSRLSKSGKFHADTAGILAVLVYVIQEQGRYSEAEQLQRQVIDIYQGLGYGVETGQMVNAQLFLTQILNLKGQYKAASQLYDQIDVWTAKWEPSRREAISSGLARVAVMLSQGNNDNALEIARRTYERERQRSGDKSFNTALSRGFHGIALARKGNASEALQAFNEYLPVLLSTSGGNDEDSGSTAAAREGRVRFVIEGYLRLLSRNPSIATPSAIEETFGYADVLRGQSVQRALQASSARSATKSPVLAQMVRTSQDSEKQIGAAVATLNNLLSLPTSERDVTALTSTQAEIARLQAARAQTLKDIAKKFPDYGNLVNPPPPSSAELQNQLSVDEALLSFYFGRFDSFVWILRKKGPVQFVRIDTTLGHLNAKVTKLREALEPNAAMISDIPAFDLKLAYDLYATLLKPAEANWKPAKNLIVVTNDALGLLPLSLLPTAPSEINLEDDPLFSRYRKVPWLARTHAVTLVPSISALLTLRKLPLGTPSRQELIGFGDPLFSQEQAAEAASGEKPVEIADSSNVTRGMPLKRRASPKLDGVDR